MQLKHLSCPAYIKAMSADDGVVEAIVSVYGNRDSYGEVVQYGAWGKSIAKKKPAVCWMHDLDHVVAKCLEARELPAGDPMLPDPIKGNGGLYVKCQFFKDITDSWQAFLKLKEGLVDEWSVGFMATNRQDTADGMDLIEGELWEVSPVVRGANPLTATVSAKGKPLADHFASLLDGLDDLATRCEWLEENRRNGLSAENRTRVEAVRSRLDALLAEPEPAPDLLPGEGEIYLYASRMGLL